MNAFCDPIREMLRVILFLRGYKLSTIKSTTFGQTCLVCGESTNCSTHESSTVSKNFAVVRIYGEVLGKTAFTLAVILVPLRKVPTFTSCIKDTITIGFSIILYQAPISYFEKCPTIQTRI